MAKKLFIAVTLIISLFIMLWLVVSGIDDMREIVKNAKWGFLFFSVAASGASYMFIGFSLWEVLRLLGYRLAVLEVLGIALVSTTANYFVSSVGISGFALRTHLLRKRHVPYGASVTTSVVITVLLYMMLALIVIQGCVLMILRPQTGSFQLVEGLIGVAVMLGISFSMGAFFFHHEFRAKWSKALFRNINHVIYFFSQKEIPQETFRQFESQLEHGIKLIHSKKHELTKAVVYICMDWICTMLILYFAFIAIGIRLDIGRLVVGFSLGMVATLIPILPGGLGAMEVAMTAAYSQMGIPWGAALMASLIFRFSYYLLPAGLGLLLYWGFKISEPAELNRGNGDGETDGPLPE